jgi:Zn-dependent protease with chaperone function
MSGPEERSGSWDNRADTTSREVRPGEHGNLLERFRIIAARLNLEPPPTLRVSSGPADARGTPTGVTISQGLLDTLTPQEVDAVLAHELGHVRDMRLKRAFNDYMDGERAADRTSIEVTANPDALIRALDRMSKMTTENLIRQTSEYRRTHNLPSLSQAALSEDS